MASEARFPFACPACLAPLTRAGPAGDDVDRLECTGCARAWPVRFGIPDLRADGVRDPYLTVDEDLRAAERLVTRTQSGGFRAALAAYYETNERVSPAQAARFVAGVLAAEERARAVLAAWRSHGAPAGVTTLLEVGCGTGPLLAAAAAPNVWLAGVDVGFRWLVLAAARLGERGAVAALACAGADHLPVAARQLDVVASESLLENVPDATLALAEAARVLRPDGRLWLTTANRRSVGPDPHVGMWMGGWFPDHVVARWAARRNMVPPRRRLLDGASLRRAATSAGFERLTIEPAPVAPAQAAGASPVIRAAIGAYRVIAGVRPGRALLTAIGPSLLATARAPDGG